MRHTLLRRLVLNRSSHRLLGIVVAVGVTTVGVTVCPSVVRAQSVPGFAMNRFEPSERGSEWFVHDSLDLRGNARPALGIVADYGYRPQHSQIGDASVVSRQLFAHVGGSLTLFDRLRLGVNVPIAIDQGGSSVQRREGLYIAPDSGGLGDVRLSADVLLLGAHSSEAGTRLPFRLAIGALLFAPTGNADRLLGDGKARVTPHVLLAGDVGAFTWSATLGFVYRAREKSIYMESPIGSEVQFGLAAGARMATGPKGTLVIGPELWATTSVAETGSIFSAQGTPMAVLLGGHYATGDFRVGLGAGPGLSHAAGTALVRGLLSLEWAPAPDAAPLAQASDRDGDSIFDTDDGCLDVPGVKTDDPRTNGCPPLSDGDKDGIADAGDACVDVAGAKTDDPATNGCPPDKDEDGIVDAEDACIDVAGTKTDDPKTNGCPADQDGDGVPDDKDACVGVAGVKTDDAKTNGCPADRDKDGILDLVDACPNDPGSGDPDPKKNGCPAVVIVQGQLKILEQVKFQTGSAVILGESDGILSAVMKTLAAHPEIKKLRIEGHTDNVGSAAMNLTLSKNRAAAVVAWLVKHGVDKKRLTSVGFGADKPIDSNDTEAGRKNNRRVEFHIEE
jgi:OOP family OmpA-OmpF porin